MDIDDIDIGPNSGDEYPLARYFSGDALDAFLRKASDLLSTLGKVEYKAILLLNLQKRGEDLFLPTELDVCNKQTAYTELAERYDKSFATLNTLVQEYRVLFGRKRTGEAFEMLSRLKRLSAALRRSVFSPSSPIRKRLFKRSHCVKNAPVLNFPLFHRIDGVFRSYKDETIETLVSMYEMGLSLNYTDSDAAEGVSSDQRLIYVPGKQRSYIYAKMGKTGSLVGYQRAVRLVKNAASGLCSLGTISLMEVAPNVYELIDGYQRIKTFFLIFRDEIPVSTLPGKKSTKVFFSSLSAEDKNLLKGVVFNVEYTMFSNDIPQVEREKVSSTNFILLNTAEVSLTEDEIALVRIPSDYRDILRAVAETEGVRNTWGLHLSDDRASLRYFLLRCVVLSVYRKINNDMVNAIAKGIPLVRNWDQKIKDLVFVLDLCWECNAYFLLNRFSKPVAETFVSSFLVYLENFPNNRKHILDNRTAIKKAHTDLTYDSSYIAHVRAGVNNQGNIELYRQGIWAGRYPVFFKRILDDVLEMESDIFYPEFLQGTEDGMTIDDP